MIMRMTRRLPLALAALLCIFTACPAFARTSADVSAMLSTTAVHAGDETAIFVIIDVHQGLHAQSHTPLEKNLIPLVMKADANPAADLKDPVYPPPQLENYPQLGPVSVYTGRVIVQVPIAVKADAPLGPLKLTGSVRYQACNDRACFAPETQKFEVNTQVVAPGVKTEPTTISPTTAPTTQAATTTAPPSSGNASSPPKQQRIFGRELGSDAYLL